MPSRGRHQSTSKECKATIKKIEALPGVIGIIIGRSYGGKSLGNNSSTGAIKIQRQVSGGIKAAMQSEKGLQEIYIRTEPEAQEAVTEVVAGLH